MGFTGHSVTVYVNIQLGMLHADLYTNIIKCFLKLLSTVIGNIFVSSGRLLNFLIMCHHVRKIHGIYLTLKPPALRKMDKT